MNAKKINIAALNASADALPGATNTSRAYSGDQRAYEAFCNAAGVDPYPVASEVLKAFVHYLATVGNPAVDEERRTPLRASSIERAIGAVVHRHRTLGHDQQVNTLPAREAMTRFARVEPQPARPAAAATASALDAMLGALQAGLRTELVLLRDTTMVLMGYGLASRRSELVAVDIEHVQFVDDHILVQITRLKTHSAPEWLPIVEERTVASVKALVVALAEAGITGGPLFRSVDRWGNIGTTRLSAQVVRLLMVALSAAAELAVPAGNRSWSAHSLRSGWASDAHSEGLDVLELAAFGGWQSNSTSLARYVRVDNLAVARRRAASA